MTTARKIVNKLTSHPEKDAYSFVPSDGGCLYFMSYLEEQGVYRMKVDKDFKCQY